MGGTETSQSSAAAAFGAPQGDVGAEKGQFKKKKKKHHLSTEAPCKDATNVLKLLEKNRPRTHLAAHQEQKAWPRACIKVQLVRGQRRCQNDGLGSGPAGQLVKPPPGPGLLGLNIPRPPLVLRSPCS